MWWAHLVKHAYQIRCLKVSNQLDYFIEQILDGLSRQERNFMTLDQVAVQMESYCVIKLSSNLNLDNTIHSEIFVDSLRLHYDRMNLAMNCQYHYNWLEPIVELAHPHVAWVNLSDLCMSKNQTLFAVRQKESSNYCQLPLFNLVLESYSNSFWIRIIHFDQLGCFV